MASNLSIRGYAMERLFRGASKLMFEQVSNGVAWLDDIQQFYRERSAIEKEYSQKLYSLAKKHFEKAARKSSSLSVGDTPTLTPGSLEWYCDPAIRRLTRRLTEFSALR